MRTFTLPYEPGNYNVILNAESEEGVSMTQISVSINNTPPYAIPVSITGSEDA